VKAAEQAKMIKKPKREKHYPISPHPPPKPDELGFALSTLPEKYMKAYMFVYHLDNSVGPWLIKELRRYARSVAKYEKWPEYAIKEIHSMVLLSMAESIGGRKVDGDNWTQELRAYFMGYSLSTFKRRARYYETIFGALRGRAWIAFDHVRRVSR